MASLLKRSFSPRATPRTTPARPLHSSSRGLAFGHGLRGAAGVAAAALAGGGALAYYMKDPHDDEAAAREKEEDMKARFEDWAKKYNRSYRDEKEKAMRFQVFKDNIKWIESQPPSARKCMLPGNCFADLKDEELPPCPPILSI
ncbi:hypothetical protein QYE76_037018 [Lolium multiflorum]|uniref:Cathepsin propeptide inhibitor domain-containing protein n=1 Tax=Lolium multiflorum TaxID=4521 RepID=A0AAD8R3K8_LOLMU|nr:hypothetical protein QYE76_037018 [Lolium multiflorum]